MGISVEQDECEVEICVRNQLEEDLAVIEDEGILGNEKRSAVIEESCSQMFREFGGFIDYKSPVISKLFPGLGEHNKDAYSIKDSRVRVFVIPASITISDGKTLTFEELIRSIDYHNIENTRNYPPLSGLTTGKGERVECVDDNGSVVILDMSDRVIVLVKEPPNIESTEGIAVVKQTIRHEIGHLLQIGDNISQPFLHEGLVEYAAYMAAPPGIIPIAYKPAFEFVDSVVRYMEEKGRDTSLLVRAFVQHDVDAVKEISSIINDLLSRSGIDPHEFFTKLSRLYLEKQAEAYNYIKEINAKISEAQGKL